MRLLLVAVTLLISPWFVASQATLQEKCNAYVKNTEEFEASCGCYTDVECGICASDDEESAVCVPGSASGPTGACPARYNGTWIYSTTNLTTEECVENQKRIQAITTIVNIIGGVCCVILVLFWWCVRGRWWCRTSYRINSKHSALVECRSKMDPAQPPHQGCCIREGTRFSRAQRIGFCFPHNPCYLIYACFACFGIDDCLPYPDRERHPFGCGCGVPCLFECCLDAFCTDLLDPAAEMKDRVERDAKRGAKLGRKALWIFAPFAGMFAFLFASSQSNHENRQVANRRETQTRRQRDISNQNNYSAGNHYGEQVRVNQERPPPIAPHNTEPSAPDASEMDDQVTMKDVKDAAKGLMNVGMKGINSLLNSAKKPTKK